MRVRSVSELSRLLNELNRDDWSLRAIERKAADAGHKLSYSTASGYLSGKHPRPTPEILAAFAAVFRVDVNKLREAAGMPTISGEPLDLGPESARLNTEQRAAIRHVVRVMLEESGSRGDTAPMNDEVTRRRESRTVHGTGADPDAPPLPAEYAAYKPTGSSESEHMNRERNTAGEESQDPEGY